MDAAARACAGGIAEFVTYRKGKNLGASGTFLRIGAGCSSAGGMIYNRFSVLSAHATVFLAVGVVEMKRSAVMVSCSHVTAIVANLVARGVVSVLMIRCHITVRQLRHIVSSTVNVGAIRDSTLISARTVAEVYFSLAVYVNMSSRIVVIICGNVYRVKSNCRVI